MEAANRGAREAGVPSIGLDIELPHEQAMNEWVDLQLTFHYFFTRKVMFVRYASAFVALPGGFGTLDELFEAATLRQTRKIKGFPIVLLDSAYWQGLMDWLAARCWRAARSSRTTSSACASPTTSARCSRSARPPITGARARPSYSRASSTHSPSRRPSVRRSWPQRNTAWSSSVPGRSMTCTSSSSAGSAPRRRRRPGGRRPRAPRAPSRGPRRGRPRGRG